MKKFIILLILLCFQITSYAKKELILSGVDPFSRNFVHFIILKEVYRKAGIKIKVDYFPAQRSLKVANNGEYDGELYRIAGIEKKYTNLIPVPTSFSNLEFSAFVKNNRKVLLPGLSSLHNYFIGIRRGIIYSEKVAKNMRHTSFNNLVQLFQALRFGRIDIAFAPRFAGIAVIKQEKITGIHEILPPLAFVPFYHYLHKRNKDLVPILNKVIIEMKESGELDKIYKNFIKKNIAPSSP